MTVAFLPPFVPASHRFLSLSNNNNCSANIEENIADVEINLFLAACRRRIVQTPLANLGRRAVQHLFGCALSDSLERATGQTSNRHQRHYHYFCQFDSILDKCRYRRATPTFKPDRFSNDNTAALGPKHDLARSTVFRFDPRQFATTDATPNDELRVAAPMAAFVCSLPIFGASPTRAMHFEWPHVNGQPNDWNG